MKAFFDQVRRAYGPLSQSQVDGFTVLLNATAVLPLTHRAYVLATAWWETDHTMQPVPEIGRGKGKEYGKPAGPYDMVYYGRGYVQLTWVANYDKAGKALGIDLVREPGLAMQPHIAAKIIVRGMTEGWFTGKKLADYNDYVAMRRIVNGTDHAADIAMIAHVFEAGLLAAAQEPAASADPPPAAPVPETPPAPPPAPATGIVALIIAFIVRLLGRTP